MIGIRIVRFVVVAIAMTAAIVAARAIVIVNGNREHDSRDDRDRGCGRGGAGGCKHDGVGDRNVTFTA